LHQIQIDGAASTTELDRRSELSIRFYAHRLRIDAGFFADFAEKKDLRADSEIRMEHSFISCATAAATCCAPALSSLAMI